MRQFVKVNHYGSKYCIQYVAFAATGQQAINGPKITSVKQFEQGNQRSNLYTQTKWETRNTYVQHQQTTTTKQHVGLCY